MRETGMPCWSTLFLPRLIMLVIHFIVIQIFQVHTTVGCKKVNAHIRNYGHKNDLISLNKPLTMHK